MPRMPLLTKVALQGGLQMFVFTNGPPDFFGSFISFLPKCIHLLICS